jgi:probable phosphoglycerate mutase
MRAQKSSTIYLLRHGHSTANAKSILAGRDSSVSLSERGIAQARAIREEFDGKKFAKIYSSPMPRCLETLSPFISASKAQVEKADGLIEMEYGDWSGKKLLTLSRMKMWSEIQSRPSLVRFPNGESFSEMQSRALETVKNLALPGKEVLFCSHGDVIKAIVAGLLGLHLDNFQRLAIDPASITVIEISSNSAQVRLMNSTAHLKEVNSSSGKASRSKNVRLNLGGGSGESHK